jgi:hypothetical protein
MSDELDPIEPSLGELFAAERTRDAAPAAAKARVAAKLAGAFAAGVAGAAAAKAVAPGMTAASAASSGLALKLLAALAVGAVIGGGVVAVARPPQVFYVDRIVSAPASAPPGVVSVPVVAPAPAVSEMPSATPSAAPPASTKVDIAAERALLDVARTALGRGDGAHALEAVDRHAHEFPRGQLTEEREAIAVQALAKLGRCPEARKRGQAFKTRYTNSVLAPVVDAALDVCGDEK